MALFLTHSTSLPLMNSRASPTPRNTKSLSESAEEPSSEVRPGDRQEVTTRLPWRCRAPPCI